MTNKNKKGFQPVMNSIKRKLGTTQGKGNALFQIVCTAVPQNLRSSIVFARIKNKRLHVVTTTGASASRLRFSQRALLEACAVMPEAPEQVYIRVAPEGTVREAPEIELRKSNRKKPLMGTNAATDIMQAAESIEDKKLCEALQRLASRGRH